MGDTRSMTLLMRWSRLFAPPVFLLVPVVLAARLTLPPAAGDAAVLVNGQLSVAVGRPPASYVVWSVAVVALAAAAGALALVSGLYLSAGRFDGRVAAAIREAVRRSGALPGLAALVALRLLPHALVVALSAVAAQWTGRRWIVVATVAAVVTIALRLRTGPARYRRNYADLRGHDLRQSVARLGAPLPVHRHPALRHDPAGRQRRARGPAGRGRGHAAPDPLRAGRAVHAVARADRPERDDGRGAGSRAGR
ncbi:hypothetical protein FAF44_45245 [Nonomuraea sp. MG754425]|uniref:hypothetical protein n=1 Tax=Nonomuraea sp. MG754425 TaxID=2570319 RepID=UPI001F352560|nr:hypothetical protein [Nonomuraea sp. MG754425]MCF6475515.1 hypothetical protein [Nonomuraea sp. MG754425]